MKLKYKLSIAMLIITIAGAQGLLYYQASKVKTLDFNTIAGKHERDAGGGGVEEEEDEFLTGNEEDDNRVLYEFSVDMGDLETAVEIGLVGKTNPFDRIYFTKEEAVQFLEEQAKKEGITLSPEETELIIARKTTEILNNRDNEEAIITGALQEQIATSELAITDLGKITNEVVDVVETLDDFIGN